MGLISVMCQEVCLVVIFSCIIHCKDVKVVDVLDYGAVRDGKTDCSQAFLKAWDVACNWTGGARFLVQKGTYLASITIFKGPCKGPIDFRMNGILMAPLGILPYNDTWIKFIYISELYLGGIGTFNGEGPSAWHYNDCANNSNCKALPANLRFDFVNDSMVSGISSVDSKNLHINVFACHNMIFDSIKIIAPEDSPNTDGIHFGESTFINISHVNIGTGDDCISFSGGNNNIFITNVTCGPGHGISIGSLGGGENETNVVGITVKNCTFIGTQNGVRIKTWAKPFDNLIKDITFDHIDMYNVNNPIVIDQNYCPYNKCDHKASSKVQIRDIKYKNIQGTSASKVAIYILCSTDFPCQDIELNNISLIHKGEDGPALEYCKNAKGVSFGMQQPPSCFK